MRSGLGWTKNGPLRGGSNTVEIDKLTKAIVNRISVAKLEEFLQLQFEQDFPDARQSEDIEMSKEDHQLIKS